MANSLESERIDQSLELWTNLQDLVIDLLSERSDRIEGLRQEDLKNGTNSTEINLKIAEIDSKYSKRIDVCSKAITLTREYAQHEIAKL